MESSNSSVYPNLLGVHFFTHTCRRQFIFHHTFCRCYSEKQRLRDERRAKKEAEEEEKRQAQIEQKQQARHLKDIIKLRCFDIFFFLSH